MNAILLSTTIGIPNSTEVDRHQALKTLGLDGSASEEEINDRFTKLVLDAHPDRGGTGDVGALVEARDTALGKSSASEALVPVSLTTELVRMSRELAELRAAADSTGVTHRDTEGDQGGTIVRQIAVAHQSLYRELRWRAVAVGAIGATFAGLSATVLPGLGAYRPAATTMFAFIVLAAGLVGLAYTMRASRIERDLSVIDETLSDKSTCSELLYSIIMSVPVADAIGRALDTLRFDFSHAPDRAKQRAARRALLRLRLASESQISDRPRVIEDARHVGLPPWMLAEFRSVVGFWMVYFEPSFLRELAGMNLFETRVARLRFALRGMLRIRPGLSTPSLRSEGRPSIQLLALRVGRDDFAKMFLAKALELEVIIKEDIEQAGRPVTLYRPIFEITKHSYLDAKESLLAEMRRVDIKVF